MSETSAATEAVTVAQPVIDMYWVGLFTIEEVRVKTPGVIMPSELIDWFRTYPGVARLAVADDEQLGQTDAVHFTWTEKSADMFGSVIIEMICAYFGWDRTNIQFTGSWADDEEEELAYAKRVLGTVVPPLGERTLVLQPSLDYVVNGTVEVTVNDDGKTVLRIV